MTSPVAPGSRLGSYEILAPIGSGGMGAVWRACDHRMRREVAIKILAAEWRRDDAALARFRREALLLAAVTHPNVCQIFDLGEHDGVPFLAMELLEGESLADRLGRGPLPPPQAAAVASAVLSALAELHSRGIVHRDLKPSNVFLTTHGVKLLDFGLARRARDAPTEPAVSRSGTLYGTPRYMAPEQWTGEVSPASDLFACGALLYEMLSGRPALAGGNAAELLRAASAGPPALTGGHGVEILGRAVRRAMAANARDRFASAAEMASAVAAAHPASGETVRAEVQGIQRLLVLPLRLLRADPEIEFLSVGLADALAASLGRLPELVVHSSRAVAGSPDEDPIRLAVAAGVDAVLCGTLLRAGERVRVAAQLIEAPSGAVLAATTAEATMADLFQLQDDLEKQVAAALRVPLARRETDAAEPPRPEAYEAYLRGAGVLMKTASTTALHTARDHFRRAVELDPRLAPAWAQLGRVHRILAKYGHGAYDEERRLARQAFDTALALDPESPLAHNLYTHFEIEDLANPVQALLRLLGRIEQAPADAELFAGLVVACRFTGLFEASLAAHRQAVRLDPEVRTSVHYTYWMMGNYEKAALYDRDPTRLVGFSALPMLGRRDEALATFASWRAGIEAGLELDLGDAVHAALRHDAAACRAAAARLLGSGFRDGEGFYFVARALAEAGAVEEALATLARVVDAGFTCPSTMAGDPWLDALRSDPRYLAVAKLAADGHRHAREVFERAEGPRLLSLGDDPTVTLPGLSAPW